FGFARARHGLLGVPRPAVAHAEIAPVLSRPAALPVLLSCLLSLLLSPRQVSQIHGETAPCSQVLGVDLDGFPRRRHGLLGVPSPAVGHAEIAPVVSGAAELSELLSCLLSLFLSPGQVSNVDGYAAPGDQVLGVDLEGLFS